MLDLLKDLFSSEQFMPHGHCYLWKPGVVWLHVISDALIALAYISIPFTLVHFIRQRRDMPFSWMFLCFGMFIIACGATHMMDIWTLWTPTYWLAGLVKAVTALASVPTAILLVRLVPKALAVPSPETLRRANAELLQANVAADAANRELQAFSYSVAHDLRAPLRSIDGFSHVLLDDYADRLDQTGVEYLQKVRAGAKQMAQLIDDLLKLSRVTREELTAEAVPLSTVARAVMTRLAEADPARKVEVVIPDGIIAHGDPGLITVILDNLLGNAWKFTRNRAEGRIELGVREEQGQTTYFVRDNGAGFDMVHAEKLFGAFQRLHSDREFDGNGIGLAIVQRIVQRHGGRVWAEGAVDKGATIYFTLAGAKGT